MVVGDGPLTTSPGLSQVCLDFEPTGSPEPLALAPVEPPAHLGRLLASRKLEQVLERSRRLPTSPRQHVTTLLLTESPLRAGKSSAPLLELGNRRPQRRKLT